MNEQWSSSAGVCVQPQSREQRPRATIVAHPDSVNPSASSSVLAPPPYSVYPRAALQGPSSHCGNAVGGVAALQSSHPSQHSQPQPHHSSQRPPCLLSNGLPPNCSSFVTKKEEPEWPDCFWTQTTSSAPVKQEDSSGHRSSLLSARSTPSTSTDVGGYVSYDTGLKVLSSLDARGCRSNRRRCSFKLPACESFRLRRIAETQPSTLRRLGIASVKVGKWDAMPIAGSGGSLRLPVVPSTPVTPTPVSDTSVAARVSRVPPSHGAPQSFSSDAAHFGESELRHDAQPCTSNYSAPAAKRKSAEFDAVGTPSSQMTPRMGAADGCVPSAAHPTAAGGAPMSRQPPPSTNNNSPLLVNLLRSTSPGAGAGMHAPQQHSQAHPQRPPATPGPPQMPTPPSQSQPSSAGFSPYPYMPRTPLGMGAGGPGSVQVRPPPTPGEMTQVTPTSSQMHVEQQSQMQQQMNVERQRQMMASQQAVSQSQQIPQQGYYPPQQYNQQQQQPQQQRPMPPQGYVLAGAPHAQQPPQHAMYSHQQGQPPRPQYVQMQQQQPASAAHAVPPHYHPQMAMEQEVASAAPMQAAPPASKKRKRPSKKQVKAVEMAQQAAAAAAQQQQQQQQQQYIMEQQMNTRVPPTNAHTVDRPTMMPQMQSGQPQPGMVFPQQPRGYPASNMQSPSNAAPPGSHMQSPPSNAVYYQQQQQQQQQPQHMWPSQQQQQMLQPPRTPQMMQPQQQMLYGGQMQQQWQGNQGHPQRIAYPQGDSVSDISGASSGSVHTSPMASRNASMDFSPASQSSSTMSPLYHQQQPHMMCAQQSGQTPPTGFSYPQGPPPQGPSVGGQQQRGEQTMHMQQQQHAYIQEQQQMHVQQKNPASMLESEADFVMQDDLGANIADDCGDFNDLDSIEPMTESSDVSATLMASHQQQMQQQQPMGGGPPQHRHAQQQQAQVQMNRQLQQQQPQFGGSMQMHRVGQGYDPNMMQIPTSSQSDCAPQRQQHPGYVVQQPSSMQPVGSYPMQQQQPPHAGGYGMQQASTSQTGYAPTPQQHVMMSSSQGPGGYPHQHGPSASHSGGGYMMSSMPQQQQQQQHVARTPMNTPPVGHSNLQQHQHPQQQQQQQQQQGHHSVRPDHIHPSRSDGRSSPSSLRAGGNMAKERDKDPINSTIETVVMRALTDQDGLGPPVGPPANANQNRAAGPRSRVPHSSQASSSSELAPSGKYVAGNGNASGMKVAHPSRQPNPPASRQMGHHQQQQQQQSHGGEVHTQECSSPRPVNGQPSAANMPMRSSSLAQQLTSSTPVHINRRASTSSVGPGDIGDDSESCLLANGQKDRKMSDSVMSAPEQRLNNASYTAQHHLSNGHDPHLIKEFRFVQQPNGVSTSLLSEDERRTLSNTQHTSSTPRTPQKSSAPRRNRRKADLSQEASPQRDDDDDFYMSASAASQAPRAPYTRRVSIAGGVVVGSSGSAPSQPPFAGVSVQSAQNNFSATMARQQQQMLKQQPKTT